MLKMHNGNILIRELPKNEMFNLEGTKSSESSLRQGSGVIHAIASDVDDALGFAVGVTAFFKPSPENVIINHQGAMYCAVKVTNIVATEDNVTQA